MACIPPTSGVFIRKDARQKGLRLCEEAPSACPDPDRVLAGIRSLSAKRGDGLVTSEQLRGLLRCDLEGLDVALRALERAGRVVAVPAAGRISVVVLAEGDERAPRRAARPGDSDALNEPPGGARGSRE